MDDLLEFARRYTAAWCSGDPRQVAEHYSRDGSLTINGGSPSIGREAITEAARGFMDGFAAPNVVGPRHSQGRLPRLPEGGGNGTARSGPMSPLGKVPKRRPNRRGGCEDGARGTRQA